MLIFVCISQWDALCLRWNYLQGFIFNCTSYLRQWLNTWLETVQGEGGELHSLRRNIYSVPIKCTVNNHVYAYRLVLFWSERIPSAVDSGDFIDSELVSVLRISGSGMFNQKGHISFIPSTHEMRWKRKWKGRRYVSTVSAAWCSHCILKLKPGVITCQSVYNIGPANVKEVDSEVPPFSGERIFRQSCFLQMCDGKFST